MIPAAQDFLNTCHFEIWSFQTIYLGGKCVGRYEDHMLCVTIDGKHDTYQNHYQALTHIMLQMFLDLRK